VNEAARSDEATALVPNAVDQHGGGARLVGVGKWPRPALHEATAQGEISESNPIRRVVTVHVRSRRALAVQRSGLRATAAEAPGTHTAAQTTTHPQSSSPRAGVLTPDDF